MQHSVITDNARQFGAAALFNQILSLLVERTLEDQERHLLVKFIDRVLYRLHTRLVARTKAVCGTIPTPILLWSSTHHAGV
jgi:hypothetical protein